MAVSQSPSCQNMAGTLESGEGSFTGAVSYFFGRTRLITWPCQWRLSNSTTHPPLPQLVPRWVPGVVTGGPWIGEILKGAFVGRGQAVLSFTWMILLGRNGSEQKLPELYASFIESELTKKRVNFQRKEKFTYRLILETTAINISNCFLPIFFLCMTRFVFYRFYIVFLTSFCFSHRQVRSRWSMIRLWQLPLSEDLIIVRSHTRWSSDILRFFSLPREIHF